MFGGGRGLEGLGAGSCTARSWVLHDGEVAVVVLVARSANVYEERVMGLVGIHTWTSCVVEDSMISCGLHQP